MLAADPSWLASGRCELKDSWTNPHMEQILMSERESEGGGELVGGELRSHLSMTAYTYRVGPLLGHLH